MRKPETILMSGYGINCERETKLAFDLAGTDARIIHINDLIAQPHIIDNCKILVFPGGFSMGDDTGSGLAYANMVRDRLSESMMKFIEKDTLAIGICNGFQIMMHLGFFPVGHNKYGIPETALTFNTNARYRDLWIHLKNHDTSEKCVWTWNIEHLFLPVAHGEGRFYADDIILKKLRNSGQVILKYVNEDGSPAFDSDANPNGSLDDIAGICDVSGRYFGLMPHPERAIFSFQDPLFTLKREIAKRKGRELPEETECMKLFRNAVEYFK